VSAGGALRTGLAMGTVIGDTLVFASAAIGLGAVLGPTHPLVNGCYREFARFALLGFRARVATNGDAHLPADRRFVFVANHASHLDGPAILRALPRHPLRFVAKEELGRVPLFGPALRVTGNVMVSRADTRGDVNRLEAAQRELLESVSVLFFAEGTRSQAGELGPFKRGAAVFAIRSGLPLVAIGVHGSWDIYSRGFEVKRGGAIGVAVGEPIEVSGRALEERDALTEELRGAVAAQMRRARELAREA
jgi:1-acyl-sn-glycerol-3-phosphate acyltransferase